MASDFARMRFPNESQAYRAARNSFLDAEIVGWRIVIRHLRLDVDARNLIEHGVLRRVAAHLYVLQLLAGQFGIVVVAETI